MDEYTKRMMANAQARQKKLNTKFTDLGLQQKIPLHESQPNIPTANSRNFDEISKLKRKEVHSDSILSHQTYSVKENVERLNTACSKTSTTRISSELPGTNSPKFTHKTLNVQKENFEMEIKFNSPDDVRVEVEIVSDCENDDKDSKYVSNQSLFSKKNQSDSENDDKDSKSSNQSLSSRKDVKSRLKQLGKLYTDDAELSSPIQRTEEKFHEELSSDCKNDEIPASKKQENEARKKRFAALASDRNNWEDELSHPTTNDETSVKTPRKSWKPPAPKPPAQLSTFKTKTPPKKKSPAPKPPVTPKSDNLGSKSPTKQLKWDKNVLDSLESQGFSRIESTSQKLVFNYTRPQNETETLDKSETKENDNSEKQCLDESIENNTSPVKQISSKINIETERSEITKISEIAQKFDKESKKQIKNIPKSPSKNILSKTALFESNSPSKTKDPALLSVSERKALFEKNKGEALIPKAAFAMALPKTGSEIITKPPKEVIKSVEKTENKLVIESKISVAKTEKNKSETKSESILKPVSESSGIAGKLKALLHQATTISESQIRNARESEKQREFEMLKNRFNQNKEIIHEDILNSSEHSDVEEDHDQSSSDEDNTEISETTKMIKEKKNKIVTFQRSRESLASLASKTSKTSKKSIESTRLLSIVSPDSSNTTSNPTKRRSSGDSPVVQAVLEDVKRIKVSPPKNGKLYPCLSDIEASTANEDTEVEEQTEDRSDDNNSSIENDEEDESNAESDIADTSLGREILEAVNRNHNNSRNKRQILEESTTTSDISDVLNDMNEYLDEQSTDTDAAPTPPKNLRTSSSKNGTAASHSFNYKRSSTSSSNTSSNYLSSPIKTKCAEKIDNDIPTHILDGDSTVPLIHTVSFYRRQQNLEQRTPIKKIVRQSAIDNEIDDDFQSICDKENDQKLINEKIQHLMDEVCKQQTVISQTSQAINLCTSTIEFSGSSEEVEAERLLLLATQRRQAALHESQRLRIERTLYATSNNSNLLNVDHCSITISDIVLPLKRDYIRALTAAGGLGHHFLCLIRYAEHVFATPLIATGNPPNPPQICVRIPGTLKLEQVHPEFTITVEVYSMQAHEEILPHEIKYHIAGKDKKSGKLLTPKKSKNSSQDSKLVKPSIQSPAGPNAVRTSSFQLMGYVIFSIKEVNRTQWSLNKVPYISPLEGNIQMRVQCDISVNVEMRGFLTMFEDISGFGAWHRRWCYLKGESLSYWKYPDDERKKAPINSINLQGCITENVSLVSRDICARPNTFLLEFVRPRQPGDSESLVMVIKKDQTLIRHLLSADTKEERIEWCQQLNKALLSIKSFK